jgi:predicted dehydrogenase
VRAATGEEPIVISAVGIPNPLGTDESMTAQFRFPSGITATISASMAAGLPMSSTLRVEGDRGVLKVDNLVFPWTGHSIVETSERLDRPSTVAGLTTYDHQLAAVIDGLANGTPTLTEGADIIANAAVIDAIYAAAGFAARP